MAPELTGATEEGRGNKEMWESSRGASDAGEEEAAPVGAVRESMVPRS